MYVTLRNKIHACKGGQKNQTNWPIQCLRVLKGWTLPLIKLLIQQQVGMFDELLLKP